MIGTGQLPKFGEDSYQTTNGWWLIPTAEVTLTNFVNGLTIVVDESTCRGAMSPIPSASAPKPAAPGATPPACCASTSSKRSRWSRSPRPDQSEAEHARMTACAEAILARLGLPFRTVVLCTGDMGAGARRTHDIEVWLPGQNTYREISSVSTCGDYQARRMNARFRPGDGGKPQFLHTLNGSGLAVGRTLIAVLENGQEQDGSVTLPAALHPYLRGKTRITAEGALA